MQIIGGVRKFPPLAPLTSRYYGISCRLPNYLVWTLAQLFIFNFFNFFNFFLLFFVCIDTAAFVSCLCVCVCDVRFCVVVQSKGVFLRGGFSAEAAEREGEERILEGG